MRERKKNGGGGQEAFGARQPGGEAAHCPSTTADIASQIYAYQRRAASRPVQPARARAERGKQAFQGL